MGKIFSPYAAKALLAALISGVTVVVAGLEADSGLTAYEFGAAVLAALVTLGAVYNIPNRPSV